MDPIAYILSTLITTSTMPIQNHINDTIGIEVTPMTVMYDGQQVDYQYQVWRIRPESVCAKKQRYLKQYSSCTLAAKKIFQELCVGLNNKGSAKDIKIRKLNRMYCNSAASYRPTIAQISSVKKAVSKGNSLRAKCNALIIDTLGNDDPVLTEERDRICAKSKE